MQPQPRAKTLPTLLAEIASMVPKRDAIVAADGRLTYAELHADVRRVACGLAGLGIGQGDKVAILMGNRSEWIVAALAITSLGGVVVALNTWWTARELAYALSHAEAAYVICPRRYLRHDYAKVMAEIRESHATSPRWQGVIGVGDDLPEGWIRFDALGRAAPTDVPPEVDVEPDDVAFLLYTSGSTSLPKGVPLVHRGLIDNMWNIGERQRVTNADRLWLAVSLFWGYGCANAFLTVLTHGACLVLQDAFEAGEALRLIEAERCTMIYGTPNMIQALADHPEARARDLSSLRTGTTFGSPSQVARAVALGATEICNVYGMTETYGNSHTTEAQDPPEVRLRCCGHPLPGVVQKIVDPRSGIELGVGQIGEIRLKGFVTPGYYKDPQQTAQSVDEDGFFKTSDLGLIDEHGRLHFRGRLKEMVKTGGINVSPAEIEAVLMMLADVHLAIVVGVPHETRDEVLGALVIVKPGCVLPEDRLLAHCQRQLARYKVPRLFRLVDESALPLTTTGKVQKNRIAALFFASAAEQAAADASN